ncbi:hypothetical protein J7K25_01000 [bacterium]|nr:hypothetical protein [bacterium]
MSGVKNLSEKEKIQQAFNILYMLVRCFAHSCDDPSELESIGYVVIAKLLREKSVRSWQGLVRVSLRNAFRDYIKRRKKYKAILKKYRYRIYSSLYMRNENQR